MEYNYTVELESELGKRNGTMQVFISGSKINGVLSILNHSEPFWGYIDTDGKCVLNGKIVTLIREFNYTATGTILSESISLDIYSDKSKFKLKGSVYNIAKNE